MKWSLFGFLSSTIDKAIKSVASRSVWVIVIHSPPSRDRVITPSPTTILTTVLVTGTIATPWATITMIAVTAVTVTWREKRGGERGRERERGEFKINLCTQSLHHLMCSKLSGWLEQHHHYKSKFSSNLLSCDYPCIKTLVTC